MNNADELIGNPEHDNSRYCFAKQGELYLVYLPEGGKSTLNLNDVQGEFDVSWFNPREGGDLQRGSIQSVDGGQTVKLGGPPRNQEQDWLVIVQLH